MTPVDVDLRIRDAMEDKGCRRHPKLSSAANTAHPLDDEINVEREIAGPVLIVRVANAELDRPNVAVVPGEAIEIRFGIGHCFPPLTNRLIRRPSRMTDKISGSEPQSRTLGGF